MTPRVPHQNKSFTRVIYVQINIMCSANMTRFMLSGELRTTILTKDISSLLTLYLYLDDLYLRDLPHSVVEKNTSTYTKTIRTSGKLFELPPFKAACG